MGISSIFALWRLFKRYRKHIALLTVLGFMSAILEGVGVNAIVPMFSFFTGGGNNLPTDFITRTLVSIFNIVHVPFTFRYLLIFMMLLFVARAVFIVVFGYLRSYITADFLSKETNAMLGSILKASWPYLLKQKLGTLQNTAIRDVQQSAALLTLQVQIIQSGSGLCIYLLVAFNISPITTVLTLLAGGILFFLVRPIVRRVTRMAGDIAATEKSVSQFLSEHIIGMKIVKAAGAEAQALKVGERYVAQLRDRSVSLAAHQALGNSLSQPFMIVFITIVFLISYKSGQFNIISFAATIYLIQKTFTYIDSAQSALQGVAATLPYAHNLINFKESLATHQEEPVAGSQPFSLTEAITLDRVSLSYEKDRPVLKNINLTIPRGTTVGLIGPSGSGKTSLADLLLRLFEPTSGHITVDGVPADTISRNQWRKNVGYVAQDVFMLNGTIEENICFYRPNVPHEKVVEAAKQANIHDFIHGLPQGYDTITGDRGVMLSGGQRQRIALARALLGTPQLLVLDEATSALDTESENVIQDAITKLHGAMTVVIIAHRLSTIEHVDTLFVLKGGELVESGTPQELRKNPHSYLSEHSAV